MRTGWDWAYRRSFRHGTILNIIAHDLRYLFPTPVSRCLLSQRQTPRLRRLISDPVSFLVVLYPRPTEPRTEAAADRHVLLEMLIVS